MNKIISLLLSCIFILVLLSNCAIKEEPLGSKKNPVKIYFIPSAEAGKIVKGADELEIYLEKETGYEVKTFIPNGYAAVIEAMGSGEADIAFFSTFAYVLAHQKNGARPRLRVIRNGEDSYYSQIITHSDNTDINSLEDCAGKSVAWTTSTSTAGYIWPKAMFKEKGIKLGKENFYNTHDAVVKVIYNQEADIGATFYSTPKDSMSIQDARYLVESVYPDVVEKVKIVTITDPIPNESVTFRADFPAEIEEIFVNALMKYVRTPEGLKVLEELYAITDFKESQDSDYDIVRQRAKILGLNIISVIK